jgi:hypothetical protein
VPTLTALVPAILALWVRALTVIADLLDDAAPLGPAFSLMLQNAMRIHLAAPAPQGVDSG